MNTSASPIQPGRYPGSPTGVASVYENDKGSLVLAMDFNVEGLELRWWCTLATTKDGINEKNIAHLREVFPAWDGADPFWLVDNRDALVQCEVEITVELRPGTKNPDRLFPSIAFVDPPGGGSAELPQGDRRELLAKYGARFRAIAGGTPSKPHGPGVDTRTPRTAPERPQSGQAGPPPARVPASASGRPPTKKPQPAPAMDRKPSTQEECWAAWCKANPTASEKELADGWWAMLGRLLPGVSVDSLTPEQWGLVMADVNDYLPF